MVADNRAWTPSSKGASHPPLSTLALAPPLAPPVPAPAPAPATARGSTADNLRRARTALGFQTRAKRAVWGNFPRARTAHGSTMKKLPHSCAARVFILLWSRAIAHGFSHKRKRCRRAWLAHGFYQEGHFFFRVAHGPLSTFSPVATISRQRLYECGELRKA